MKKNNIFASSPIRTFSSEDVDTMEANDLKTQIRNIPDFPEKGIVFRDITTLLQNPDAFNQSIKLLTDAAGNTPIDLVVGIEARGFIFGGALAARLGAGFIPVRKSGKLPAETIERTYELEYGSDTLAMHRDAVCQGHKVLMFDDLLATGGTMAASCHMVEELGGEIVSCLFLIELAFLNGRSKLQNYPVHSLLVYDEE